ncbi:MAG: hypothetical protein KatS3mg105_4283 [Gemmatales bacterium]|nr:MAG: hypothetical protein KatS3mg105_4283 [Gemmatales bacterium]
MRVSILTKNACWGDAVGAQVAAKVAFFLDCGADIRVFAEDGRFLHPVVEPFCRTLDADNPGGDGWRFLRSSDLVIVEFTQHYSLLQLVPILARQKLRLIIDYHGITPPELWNLPHADALRQGIDELGLLWCADAVLTHSRFTRQEVLDKTGLPEKRVFTLGYPVDLSFWSGPDGEQSLRSRLGLESARILLFVGRLAPNKRVPLLVEALAAFRDEYPPVHAVIVGNQGDAYAQEAERCRQLAEKLGVSDRLHLLGKLGGHRLREAYRSADVFVMPSLHEGFCLPVIEAMAAGLPVVAARSTALPGTVGNAGLTFTPDDVDDLVRQLRRIWETDLVSPSQKKQPDKKPLRLAVVSARFGTHFVGGAETSLRLIANTLANAGHRVEVFTTSNCAATDRRKPITRCQFDSRRHHHSPVSDRRGTNAPNGPAASNNHRSRRHRTTRSGRTILK